MPDSIDLTLARQAEVHPDQLLRAIAAYDGWLVPVVRADGVASQQIIVAGGERHAVAFSSVEAAHRWPGVPLSDELATVDGRSLAASLSDDLTSVWLDGGEAHPLQLTAPRFAAFKEAATAARAIRLLAQPERTEEELLRVARHATWRVLLRRHNDHDALDVVEEAGKRLLVVCSGADAAQAWLETVPEAQRPPAQSLVIDTEVLCRESAKIQDIDGFVFDPMGPGPTVRQPAGLAIQLLAALATA